MKPKLIREVDVLIQAISVRSCARYVRSSASFVALSSSISFAWCIPGSLFIRGLPWPAPFDFENQRPAKKRSNEHKQAKDHDVSNGGFKGDGPYHICGNKDLQTEQKRTADDMPILCVTPLICLERQDSDDIHNSPGNDDHENDANGQYFDAGRAALDPGMNRAVSHVAKLAARPTGRELVEMRMPLSFLTGYKTSCETVFRINEYSSNGYPVIVGLDQVQQALQTYRCASVESLGFLQATRVAEIFETEQIPVRSSYFAKAFSRKNRVGREIDRVQPRIVPKVTCYSKEAS